MLWLDGDQGVEVRACPQETAVHENFEGGLRGLEEAALFVSKQMPPKFWTNPSVLALSGDRDPIGAITERAREVVFHALERGWHGPPFDPFALAELLGIQTQPTPDVLDARIVPVGDRYRIEFNPDRPYRRMRFSMFHEIAHTLFSDCAQTIRNRGEHKASRQDEWQLETLCNIAAAELLLPAGALGRVSNLRPSVDVVLELRQRYEASAEAAVLRILRLTSESALAFSCHRDPVRERYIVEYAIPTVGNEWRLRPGSALPSPTAAEECTAIGFTAKKNEQWPRFGEIRVECVGVAPFPGDVYPRVVGFVRPSQEQLANELFIEYVRGDATLTRGPDRKLLLQVVNDAAFTWGGSGFAAAVKRRWPTAQQAFTSQVASDRSKLRLGGIVTCQVEPDVTLVNLVAQRGYGPSPRPRIRYGALRDCLLRVSEMAKSLSSSVHMPRIGTGQAGGSWAVVEEMIRETLTKVGVKVLVYDVPQGREKPRAQGDLNFPR
jgi:O-acetyl-ADP-ribose deacetylase (regulator of RNase III)